MVTGQLGGFQCTVAELQYTDPMYLLDGKVHVQKVDIQRQLTKILGQLNNEQRSRSDPEMDKGSLFLQDKRSLIVLDLLRPDQLSGLFSIVYMLHSRSLRILTLPHWDTRGNASTNSQS